MLRYVRVRACFPLFFESFDALGSHKNIEQNHPRTAVEQLRPRSIAAHPIHGMQQVCATRDDWDCSVLKMRRCEPPRPFSMTDLFVIQKGRFSLSLARSKISSHNLFSCAPPCTRCMAWRHTYLVCSLVVFTPVISGFRVSCERSGSVPH